MSPSWFLHGPVAHYHPGPTGPAVCGYRDLTGFGARRRAFAPARGSRCLFCRGGYA